MIVISGGDSFIFGVDLKDQLSGTYSTNTFPALLAKRYSAKYVCSAKGGNSNNAIARMTLDACEKFAGPKVVIVQWTFVNRYEFYIDKEWKSISVWDHSEFNNTFYKHAGNTEYFEIYNSLKEILYLQNYLELKNIPYLFLTADGMIHNTNSHTLTNPDISICSLYNQIHWEKWFKYPGKSPTGFYQWAIDNKYEVGETDHPLEQAHIDAAKMIQGKFDEMVSKLI